MFSNSVDKINNLLIHFSECDHLNINSHIDVEYDNGSMIKRNSGTGTEFPSGEPVMPNIGEKVEIYWPNCKKYYPGIIHSNN